MAALTDAMFNLPEMCPAANSGLWLVEGLCEPFWPSPFSPFLTVPVIVLFGLNGAPHSSQYCEPSKFSVLHLSQVIIGSFA